MLHNVDFETYPWVTFISTFYPIKRIQGVSFKKIPGYFFFSLDNAVIYTHSLFITVTFIMYKAQSIYKAVHLKINVNNRFFKRFEESTEQY